MTTNNNMMVRRKRADKQDQAAHIGLSEAAEIYYALDKWAQEHPDAKYLLDKIGYEGRELTSQVFTDRDAKIIAGALKEKLVAVKEGHYGDPASGTVVEWVKQLMAIAEKIGENGEYLSINDQMR